MGMKEGWRGNERKGKEDVLSRMLRFWMPSWPTRAPSPKREKPRMELSRAMD